MRRCRVTNITMIQGGFLPVAVIDTPTLIHRRQLDEKSLEDLGAPVGKSFSLLMANKFQQQEFPPRRIAPQSRLVARIKQLFFLILNDRRHPLVQRVLDLPSWKHFHFVLPLS
jgi:hypothetical protein